MKNLFKFLLLGAFTLSLGVGFVGCKNYDSDIKAICKDIEVLQGDVAKLRADIDAIVKGPDKYVTGAKLDGSNLVFTMNDNTTFNADLSDLGGTPANMPKLEGNATDGWKLSVWNATTEKYDVVDLPGAASALSKVDILGWTTGYGIGTNAAGDLSYADLETSNGTPFPIVFSYIEKFMGSTVSSADFYGFDEGGAAANNAPNADNTGAPAGTGVTNSVAADPNSWAGGKYQMAPKVVMTTLGAERKGIVVEVFPAMADITGLTFELRNNKGEVLPIAWGAPEPIKGSFNTRAASGAAVYFIPGAEDTSKTYDSAAAYRDQINGTGVAAAAVGSGTPSAANTNKRYENAYAFYVGGKKVSEYAKFPFAATEITATAEAAVKTVKTVDDAETVTFTTTGNGTSTLTAFAVKQNFTYKITEFDSKATASTNLTNNDSVIDYYFQLHDKTDFDAHEFLIEFYNGNTEFKVTRLPDAITVATFELDVYKLSVNGDIYKETLTVRPVRTAVEYTEPLGSKLIVDKDTKGVGYGLPANATLSAANAMSTEVIFSLKGMFDDLAIRTFDNTKMDQYWKNNANGAKQAELKAIKIDGKALKGTLYGGGSSDDIYNWVTAFKGAGGSIWLYDTEANAKKGSTTVGTDGAIDDLTNTTVANLGSAAGFVRINVPFGFLEGKTTTAAMAAYGYPETDTNTGADAAWVMGKEYQFVIDFKNSTGDYINTLIVTATPTMPGLAEMVERDATFWDKTAANQLNAYYKDPSTWAATQANTRYDIAVGAYTDDTMADPGGNGGFTKLGGAAIDTKWANIKFLPANDGKASPTWTQKIDNIILFATSAGTPATASVEYALTTAESDNNRIFELYYQNNASGAALPADASSTTVKVPATARDAYGVPLHIVLNNTKYLDIYPYPDADYAAQNFDIKIMSAMFEGSIAPAAGATKISMPAANAGQTVKLTHDMVKGYTYNQPVTGDGYDLFTFVPKGGDLSAARGYKYTYISGVTFAVNPASANKFFIRTNAGADTTTESVSATTGTATADDWGYLNILPGNTSGTSDVKLDVTVTDRFGKVKTTTLDMTVTVN